MCTDRLRQVLLEIVPDHPVWIEARAALLDRECRLFGDERGYAIRSDRLRLGGIGGAASEALVLEAFSDIGGHQESGEWAVVIPKGFTSDARLALATWNATEADIFREPAGGLSTPERVSGADIRLPGAATAADLEHLPGPLADELWEALERTDLAAAWVDGRAVSFCYVACETDTLWDISINTAEGYRRRGLAAATVGFLADRMRSRGKSAVWGAHSWNVASRTLAGELGFEPAGRLFLFENSPAGAH
ncbi:MAG: GNAT family N-acetyltransferase [Thermoanaerobaculia bacterium]